MPAKIYRARLALLLAATAPGAAAAAGPAISVRPAVGSEGASTTLSTPEVSLGYRIINNEANPVTVTLTPRGTYQANGTACAETGSGPCILGWQLDGKALPANRPVKQALPAYGSAELRYAGRANPLGTYESELLVAQTDPVPSPAVAATPLRVRIVRQLNELGAGDIVAGPWGRRALKLTGGAGELPLRIFNKGTADLQLPAAPQVDLFREDEASTFVATGKPVSVDCHRKGSISLKPGESVLCDLTIPDLARPGRYRADVTVGGSGLAPASAQGTLAVRYPAIVAWLLLLAGGLAGAWLAGWQNSGRRRAMQAADTLDLAEDYARIAADLDPAGDNADSKALLDTLRVGFEDMLNDLENVRTADFSTQLGALQKRLPIVHRFAALELLYRRAGAPTAAAQAYADALAAASADVLPAEASAKLDALKAAIAAPATNARVAGVPLDAAGEFFFRWPRTRSPARLRAMVSRLDTIILLGSILLVSVIGVLTLWENDATWGSPGDLAIALVSGVAATVTGAVGIKELVSGYQLARIAA